MSGTGRPQDHTERPDELLGDLESIKDLLDEEAQQPQIPVLEDIESDDSPPPTGMTDDAFNRLLSDSWKESVEELFTAARSHIEANSEQWLPEDTDDLTEALKIRIDNAVRTWLSETLQANIGLLRERMVRELSDELIEHMERVAQRAVAAKDA